jgi:hypothetical protein
MRQSVLCVRQMNLRYCEDIRPLLRALSFLATSMLMLLGAVPAEAADGHVPASAHGQVAWLDLEAPRLRPVTALQLPTYPADVTAVAASSVAIASIESRFNGTGPMGTDLVTIDLPSNTAPERADDRDSGPPSGHCCRRGIPPLLTSPSSAVNTRRGTLQANGHHPLADGRLGRGSNQPP